MTRVCIDDFALKKRERYGTIMIDIETHRVIDMIESRTSEAVSQWLGSFPNLQVVSRDGSLTYAKAIREAGDILQISDRFHLIKNLTEYAATELKKELKPIVKIPVEEGQQTKEMGNLLEKSRDSKRLMPFAEKIEMAIELEAKGILKSHICKELKLDSRALNKFLAMSPSERKTTLKSKTQKQHEERVRQKEEMVQQVRELYENECSQRGISRMLDIDQRTVKRYLDPDFDPVHPRYGKKQKSILDAYCQIIETLFLKGLSSREIEQHIREKGYTGSSGLIRRYLSKVKKEKREAYTRKTFPPQVDWIKRHKILQLLYKPLEEVKEFTQDLMMRLEEAFPRVVQIIQLVADFKTMLKTNAVHLLEGWLKKASAFDSDSLNRFVNGVQRDKMAVIHGIAFPYNNGLAEGKINKLKTIKRVMYGRCHFDSLRNKVLLLS